jgi:hypothetical protein
MAPELYLSILSGRENDVSSLSQKQRDNHAGLRLFGDSGHLFSGPNKLHSSRNTPNQTFDVLGNLAPDLTFRILKHLSIRELLAIELVCFYSMTTPVSEYLLHDQVSRKWQILPSCAVETPLLENDCK